MDLSGYLQLVSIGLEVVICSIALGIALTKKRRAGWCIALTFALYVVYDLIAYTGISLPTSLVSTIFFIATLSMLYGAWVLYSEQ